MDSEDKAFTILKCPITVPISLEGTQDSNHNKMTTEDEVKEVNMYAPDIGPKFYPVKGNVVTAPIITKNLPEAFSSLPICGRPESKDRLEQYQDQKIRDYVGGGLSEEEFGKLAKYCSPNHLRTGKELIMDTNLPAFGFLPPKKDDKVCEEGNQLNIVKKFKLRVEKDKTNLYVKKLKYRGMRLLPLTTEDEDNDEINGTPLEPGKDILYRVRFYRPFMCGKERNNSRHSVFTCDVVVSGQSRLSALRERIVCANDVDVRVDVSANPTELPQTTAKELFPSGFMFINNVFYVDEREGRVDYTEPIRLWAQRRAMGDFPKVDMHQVRLQDLVIRLGHPEVYIHQGNCEHLFTFSEVRLVGPAELVMAEQLPRHTAVLQHQTVYCTTCAEFGAKWVVVGCPRVPFDPAFFCDTCFMLYLYIDGKKIGDFKAYSYRGNEINTLKPLG
ncbi:snRNA-activating protein complex subunit 3 [Papilio xuthus]|uniref:snRNA-activating protein complex subunit 3 n=1 Tax=Papilio xuthus TaxID=66420 RepID=A0A194PVN3_PAPXU|nr:snRNA-activating protein complex subunit 3 [Papilio xuthus]